MKKLTILALLIAALGVLTLGHSQAQTMKPGTVTLNEQNGSGEHGTATITGMGTNDIKVTLHLMGGGAAMSVPQPAHIHKGTCATLDPKPAYPLNNAVNGTSETEVMTSMAELGKESYAINVHKSAAEASVYVACGDIKIDAAMMGGGTMSGGAMGGGTMPTTGNGDSLLIAGILVLAALMLAGSGLVMRRTRG